MHSPGVTVIGCGVFLGWLLSSRAPSATSPVRGTIQDCPDWAIADGEWTGTFSLTTHSLSQSPGLRASGEATVSGTFKMTQRAIVENFGRRTTVSTTGTWKTATSVNVEPGPPEGVVGYKKTGEGTLSGGRVVDPDVFRPGAKLRWIDWKASGSLAISFQSPEGDTPLETLPADWPTGTLEFLVERVSCVEISGTIRTLPMVFELAGAIQTNVANHFELRHHAADDFARLSAEEDDLFAAAQGRLGAIGSGGLVATYASTETVLRSVLTQVTELARAQPEFQLCLLEKLRQWAAPVLTALLRRASGALRQAASAPATTWQNTHETVATALKTVRLGQILGLDCAEWSTSQDQLMADIRRLAGPIVRAEQAAVEDLQNRESTLTEAQLLDGVATAERVLAEEMKLGATGPDFDSAVKDLAEALRVLYRARIANPGISDAERARWRAALARQGG